MRSLSQAEKLKRFSLLSIVTIGLVLVPAGSAYADRKPFFGVWNGDAFAGGWFSGGSGGPLTCDTGAGSNYQDNKTNPADPYRGGILAYSQANNRFGSHSQFGAFALGGIEGNADPLYYYGFSSGKPLGATKTYLTFANTTADWGGYFQGSNRQSHCIPDYYSLKKPAQLSTLPQNGLAGIAANSGAFTTGIAAGNFDLDSSAVVTLAANSHISIYSDKSVYIDKDIVYASSYTSETVPKFTLIVKGNIYIGPNVQRLEGLYIAQPATSSSSTVTADDGNIWTCHLNNTDPLQNNYALTSGCNNFRLVINGGVIAKQLNLTRTRGDFLTCTLPIAGATNGCAATDEAETINLKPETFMGGSFFNSDIGATSVGVDSLVSLPPVL